MSGGRMEFSPLHSLGPAFRRPILTRHWPARWRPGTAQSPGMPTDFRLAFYTVEQ